MASLVNVISRLLVLSALVTSGHAQIAIDVTGCGTTKGCMRRPDACTHESCDMLITWTSTASGIDFEMSGKSDGYVTLSIAPSKSMDGGSNAGCIRSSGGALAVETSYSDGHDVTSITPSNAALSSEVIEYTSGRISCTFTRALTHANSQVHNIDTSYYLQFATGSVSGSAMTEHDSNPDVSSSKVDLTSTEYQDLGPAPYLVMVHGIFMLTAWLLCAPTAYMLAAYFKERGFPVGRETLCGQKPWFSLHRILLLVVMFATALAFVLIFIHAKRWSWFGDGWDDSHAIIGTIVMILVIVNPLMAAFRPGPDSGKRVVFNWCHRIVGICSVYLALVTIMSGLQLSAAETFAPSATLYCVYAFMGFNGVCHIILGVERSYWAKAQEEGKGQENGGGGAQMSDLQGSKGKVAPDEGDAGKAEDTKLIRQKFIFAVLAVYVLVTFCIWLAIFIMFLA